MDSGNDVTHGQSPTEWVRIQLAAESSYRQFTNNEDEDTKLVVRRNVCGICDCSPRALKAVIILLLIIIFILLITVICSKKSPSQQKDASPVFCTTSECVEVAGHLIRSMNLSVDPCSDFHTYACGSWASTSPRPPDKARWDTFDMLQQQNSEIIRLLLVSDDDKLLGEDSAAVKKAKMYYSACMNSSGISDRGSQPMLQLLSELGHWPLLGNEWDESTWNLETSIAKLHSYSGPLFYMGVTVDDKNSSVNIISFDQGGLLYHQRDFYLGNDSAKYRDAEIEYIKDVAMLLGASDESIVQTIAEEIYNVEYAIADISDPKEERIDPLATYHKMALQDLQDLIGDEFKLGVYLSEMFGETISPSEQILVGAPNYFRKLGVYLNATTTTKRKLANYAVWQAVVGFVKYLSQEFQLARLQWSKTLYGVDDLPATWKTCVSHSQSALPYAVGAMFAEKDFNEVWKNQITDLLGDVLESFASRLPDLDWMDAATRQRAMEKVNGFDHKIAYPDMTRAQIDDKYTLMTLTDNSFDNAKHLFEFNTKRNLDRRGQPVDWTRWEMSAADVNAYYQPSHNEMVFPAGILQRPFFDYKYSWALNYGGVGSVMGHELSHGFDNSGRRYDEQGNMNNWWTNASADAFDERSSCLVNQYNTFQVGDSHISGDRTLGENIADNGGLKASFRAYQSWLADNDHQERKAILPGLNLTENQIFFLGFAQLWCSQQTPEYAQQALATDPHSNPRYRVIGTLQNMEEFAEAYKCPVGSVMNPANKCKLWG